MIPPAADAAEPNTGQGGHWIRDRHGQGSPVVYDRKDVFHQRAKREGYRSRAPKAGRASRAHRLRDLAIAWSTSALAGGWLQVAAEAVGPQGQVVGVDLAAIDPPLPYET
jgi:hypothetical protein